jgi:stage III sporulation protein AE
MLNMLLIVGVVFINPMYARLAFGNEVNDSEVIETYTYSDTDIADTVLESLDINEAEKFINQNESIIGDINLRDLIIKVITGKLNLNPGDIINMLLKTVVGELYKNGYIIRNILIVSIIMAVLKSLSASFKMKAVGELGFYAGYMTLVLLLFSSFKLSISMAETLISSIHDIMQVCVPLMTSLAAVSGKPMTALAFNPTIMFIIYILMGFIKTTIIVCIYLSATMQIVNYLSEQEFLSKFNELIKSGIGFTLKGLAVFITVILSLQRLSVPMFNNLAVKTGKSAVKAIPLVGDVMIGAMDSVMYVSSSIKSGVLISILIAVVLICALPLVKMAVFIFTYKFIAAIIQPISDERIVECIDSVGDYTSIVLSASSFVVFMFILVTAMFLTV